MKHFSISSRQQRGIVLLVAMIALVALSLSGIMLMRSIDTSNVVSGNFAFNEATTQMADVGMRAAENMITTNAYNNDPSNSNCNAAGPSRPGDVAATFPTGDAQTVPNAQWSNLNPGKAKHPNCPHFYSTYFTDIDPNTNLPRNFPADGWSSPIDVPNIPNGCQNNVPSTCDYTAQYFVERMCTRETWRWDNSIAPALSAVNSTPAWTSGAPTFKACLATPIYDTAGVAIPNRGRLYYRVTVQVNGPRNTRSLVQYYFGQNDTVLSTCPNCL